jgi:hypothetical protein
MGNIIADMQILTTNYAVKTATRSQVSAMIEEMRILSVGHSQSQTFPTISNYGTGVQSVHAGDGDQFTNTGSGGQFTGTFEGPFSFYLSPEK